MAMRTADVAIVTVTYNSAGVIGPFLESARGHGARVAEVVVADNPSPQTPQTLEIVHREGARVLSLENNVGYGTAVNRAVASLPETVRYILVSNPDVRLLSGAVSTLASALDDLELAGSVGPAILEEDGSIYPSARRIPSIRTGVGHALLGRIWPANPWTRAYRQEDVDPKVRREVGWLSGACLMVRRSAFDEVHGFDERYFMYFEDVDLGYRLGRSGWRNLFEPTAMVVHTGGTSTASARPQMLRAHHRSAERFLASRYTGWYLAPVRVVLRAGLRLRARWLTRGMEDQPRSSSNDER